MTELEKLEFDQALLSAPFYSCNHVATRRATRVANEKGKVEFRNDVQEAAELEKARTKALDEQDNNNNKEGKV